MKLIKGNDLTPDQKRQVLAAYVYRWTLENQEQTYRGKCPACSQAGRNGWPYVCGEDLPEGPYSYTREQWHAYHKPLQTDAQFLAEHAFYFTKDGRLSEKHHHCEPVWQKKGARL